MRKREGFVIIVGRAFEKVDLCVGGGINAITFPHSKPIDDGIWTGPSWSILYIVGNYRSLWNNVFGVEGEAAWGYILYQWQRILNMKSYVSPPSTDVRADRKSVHL